MDSLQTVVKNIPISYETDEVKVSFTIEFGKGKNSSDMSSFERTNYDMPYDIEIHKIDDVQMYCLLAEEGGIVWKVSNVSVLSKTNTYNRKIYNGYIEYKYGITTVVDINKEPKYDSSTSFLPCNDVERDGKPWIILNNTSLKVDQNGSALYQLTTAKALDKGVKPTKVQEMLGVEERHENSGMIYITFQPIYQEETHIQETEQPLTRGLTRGFTSSHAARVGYGSRAETKSKSTTAIPIPDSRFILPIRIRVIGSTFDSTIKCAKDLAAAKRVEELQKQTGVLPDY